MQKCGRKEKNAKEVDPPKSSLPFPHIIIYNVQQTPVGIFKGGASMWGWGIGILIFWSTQINPNRHRVASNADVFTVCTPPQPSTPKEVHPSHYPPICHKEQHTLCCGCILPVCMLVVCHCMGTRSEQGMRSGAGTEFNQRTAEQPQIAAPSITERGSKHSCQLFMHRITSCMQMEMRS